MEPENYYFANKMETTTPRMELLATTGQRSAAGALGTVAILVPVAVAGQVALVLVAVAFLGPAAGTAVAIAIAVVSAARAADVGKNAGVGAGLSRVVVATHLHTVSRLGVFEVAGKAGHGVWAAGAVVGVGLRGWCLLVAGVGARVQCCRLRCSVGCLEPEGVGRGVGEEGVRRQVLDVDVR